MEFIQVLLWYFGSRLFKITKCKLPKFEETCKYSFLKLLVAKEGKNKRIYWLLTTDQDIQSKDGSFTHVPEKSQARIDITQTHEGKVDAFTTSVSERL